LGDAVLRHDTEQQDEVERGEGDGEALRGHASSCALDARGTSVLTMEPNRLDSLDAATPSSA
jgi:hypothetical protein